MRILTRGDMDGLTSALLLSLAERITEIRFAHPKDVQDGKVPADAEDIVVNLPYVSGCGMWFDHHSSEDRKLEQIGRFKGRFAVAPSCARVIYDHFADRQKAFDVHRELLEATDRLDSAQLTVEDVSRPSGWILLGLTLDPRTGLGPEFQKYFRWLVEYLKEVPMAKILQHPEVKKRTDRVLSEQEEFLAILRKYTRQDGNVAVTDMRGVRNAPVGNRFLVFTLFPQANAEMRIFDGKGGENTVVAVGHSIFNRSCKVNVGEYLATFGGGGHRGAGTAQLARAKADEQIKEILGHLKANR